MRNRTKFFITSFYAVLAVCPSIAASATATQDWVQDYAYRKTQGTTLSSYMATKIRDQLYTFDTDKNSPTFQGVKNPLRTDGQNAFDGINEILEKVDGNDGTNSAVELKTNAKNAFGAINELKDNIEGLDATKSQVADSSNGNLALSVKQEDGKITEISGSVDLSDYAKTSDIPSLEGYATSSVVTSAVTSAIEGLDSSVTQSADSSNGYLTLSVTQTDGEIASVSGSVDLTSALSGYVTSAELGGYALASNVTAPSEPGDYVLKLVIDDNNALSYSWEPAINLSGGGSSSGGGNYVECDLSCPGLEWACIPCD